MRYDYRSDYNKKRSGYDAPSIRIKSNSVKWLAIIGFLTSLNARIDVHIVNMNQSDRFETFDALRNTGDAYRNDVFTLHAYDWNDEWVNEAFDEKIGDIPSGYLHPNSDNYLDAETGAAISWYKHAWYGDLHVNEAMLQVIDNDRLSELLKRATDSMHHIEDTRRSKR